MARIQQTLIDGLFNYFDTRVQKARVLINGAYVEYPINKTVRSGTTIWKYIYLETDEGYVEDAQLLGNNNEVLMSKAFQLTKTEDGRILAFGLEINVEEG